jgi:hypothetical protein
MPTVPLMMILAAEGLSGWCERWRWTTRGATVVGAGLLGLALSQWLASSAYGGLLQGWHYVRAGQSAGVLSVEQTDEPYMPDSTAGYVIMGQSLHDLTSPEASIAVVPAGAIGYFSQRTVIDMVGLTDPVIAHQPFDPAYSHTWRPGHDKGDGAYILSQRPDYIQLFDVLSREPRPQPDAFALQYKSIAELWALAEFHHQYEFSPVQVTGGWYYNLYRRRELMPTPLDVPHEQ